MAIPADIPRTDARTYLALERASAQRHEWVDGIIVQMAGASYAHNVLVANLIAALDAAFRGTDPPDGPSRCRPLGSDMRIKVEATGMYAYPDVLVICDAPAFEDERADTLLNPVAIFEVLSPSTEAFDRGEKFAHYRRLPSLKDYVLVAQDRPRLEHYRRTGDSWLLHEIDGLDGHLAIASAQGEVRMAALYAGVP